MPNTKSAKKRVRTSEVARLRNQARRTRVHTAFKKVEVHLASAPRELPLIIREAVSVIDRAAKSGAIHPRTADRRKSRLLRKVRKTLGEPVILVKNEPAKVRASKNSPKTEATRSKSPNRSKP